MLHSTVSVADPTLTVVDCRSHVNRYIEVFRSTMAEMQKRSRPPPLMSSRPGPYDRPGYPSRYGYSARSRMKG